ncbi:MAG: preprotein translocase subunit SecE [Actinobacteria bacterium]|jgi:preprotein translocase subunit SecE|nr:preprotein translocase subunit SecE [Actinomycetota bacterium]
MADARSERRAARRAGRPNEPAAPRAQTPSVTEDRRRSNFFAESWAELKKVDWPGQAQVIQGTVVVLIACLVVGTYLYVNDIVWKHVVSKVFLGQ